MNPPAALHGAMSRDRKPFTYTPGGLDLSEIKSERMAARLMRNAMNQGVPEKPPQIQSPPTPSTPIAVPNFNCLPVQVFPTFNLPANPKSLLRTRSNPTQPREAPAQRVAPPQTFVNNSRATEATQYNSFNKNTPTYSQTNNNRPASMYEYGTSANTMNYGSDSFTATFRDSSYNHEYFQKPKSINSVIKSVAPPIQISKQLDDSQKNIDYEKENKKETIASYETSSYQDYLGNTLRTQLDKDAYQVNENKFENEVAVENTRSENVTNTNYSSRSDEKNSISNNIETVVAITEESSGENAYGAIPSKPVEDLTELSKEKKEVKVVQKQVVKQDNESGDQNGMRDQNGSNDTSLQAVIKLPTKKSAAKTETKVEVTKKTLPDGSTEEIKKTITKTTIDGKTEIKTKTETTIIPKDNDESEVEEVEEQEEESEVQESEALDEAKKIVDESEQPKENGQQHIIKTEEKSETTTTTSKRITVVQDDDENAEEEEVIQEETEEVEPVTFVLKKPEEEKTIETQEEEAKEIEQEKKIEGVDIEESKEEEEIEEEDNEKVTIEDITQEDDEPEEKDEEIEEVEEEEEYQEAEGKVIEIIKENGETKESESPGSLVDAEPEIEQEETELEKEEPEPEKVESESEKEESEVLKVEIEPDKEEIETEKAAVEKNEEIEQENIVQETEGTESETKKEESEEITSTTEVQKTEEHDEKEEQTQEITEEKQEVIVEREELKVEKQEVPEEKLEPRVIKIETIETNVPFREPSVPLEKVEDIEIKPIGAGDFITKTHTENTEIITNVTDKPTGVLTEINRIENIVTVNRTIKTLDPVYDASHVISPSKTYTSPYQPVYPSQPLSQPTERRHSLLLERLSVERQLPADIYQNNSSYQYSQTVEQQGQWTQEPQAEVVTISNVKPSQITNQQWYQPREGSVFNTENSPQSAAPSWTQPKTSPQPAYQAQPQQYQATTPQPQPQYRATTPQPQTQFRATTPQPQSQYRATTPQPQPQPEYQPSYTENVQENKSSTYQNTYSSYTPKPSMLSPNQPNQYSSSFLNKDSSESYQQSSQFSSSSYVPPPWEQDSSYVAPQAPPNFYQAPPQTSTYSPAAKQGWKPTPPTNKFSKTTTSSYIPPKPNQSFVKPVTNVEPPRLPGRKTYYSEYERRYISVPETTYIPAETKFQHQPDPSPKYYYDNNEPAETVEPQWRKELREFTEKTQTQTETNVKPPWEQEAKFEKSSDATYTQTPTWSQTVRPQSWRERSFESEFVSQEWPKTNTLGRGRPLRTYGKETIVTERTRGVSVDRYNPNSYQAPSAAEHPPVQTHTHIAPAPLASGYHNPHVPAYHARASAEPREHVSYQQPRHIREARASPFQSRSFKYLQWITGTED